MNRRGGRGAQHGRPPKPTSRPKPRAGTSPGSADTPARWASTCATGRAPTTAGAAPDMRHVEWSDAYGSLILNWGQCTLQAIPGTLRLRAEAADEENLTRIQDLVAGRLEKFGRRDQLAVTWHRTREPRRHLAGPPAPLPRPPMPAAPEGNSSRCGRRAGHRSASGPSTAPDARRRCQQPVMKIARAAWWLWGEFWDLGSGPHFGIRLRPGGCGPGGRPGGWPEARGYPRGAHCVPAG
jgi:hypothetical protein